jgi:hypothetical protein
MKKRFVVLLLVSLLVLTTASLALASGGQPQGGCPDNFHPHMAMDHEHGGDGQHLHVGNDKDFNGDGYICGKHVSADGSVHVHIDNNVPLP